MVLNEFVYDPNGSSNSTLFNLTKGTFTFVAGKVAKTSDMKIDTPVATMGIRGTTPRVEISDDGTVGFSTLIEEGKSKLTRKPGAPRAATRTKIRSQVELNICRGVRPRCGRQPFPVRAVGQSTGSGHARSRQQPPIRWLRYRKACHGIWCNRAHYPRPGAGSCLAAARVIGCRARSKDSDYLKNIELCNGAGRTSFEVRIKGCTALIDFGQGTTTSLAIAFNNRGNAHTAGGL